eukprot:765104-Hanusia_phi.AAC.13
MSFCLTSLPKVKRIEEALDSLSSDQALQSDRMRENSSALRRMQSQVTPPASRQTLTAGKQLEQLDVHRGAVYAADASVQKLQVDREMVTRGGRGRGRGETRGEGKGRRGYS